MSRLDGQIFLAAILSVCILCVNCVYTNYTYAASGNKTKKLSDMTTGQSVQVGSVKFVKVAGDKYLATSLCPEGSTYSFFYKGCVVKTTTFSYTGNYQTFTAPATGPYVVELWGASGSTNNTRVPGKGGYVAGITNININQELYVYVGQVGNITSDSPTKTMTFNGGRLQSWQW